MWDSAEWFYARLDGAWGKDGLAGLPDKNRGSFVLLFFFLSIFGKWMFSFCFRLSVFHNACTHITKTNDPVSVGFSLNCISFSFGHKMGQLGWSWGTWEVCISVESELSTLSFRSSDPKGTNTSLRNNFEPGFKASGGKKQNNYPGLYLFI